MAPTVNVGAEIYVIDPSLFSGPVTQVTWAAAQNDPNPTLIPSTFWRNRNPSSAITDSTYSQTNSVLTTYRNALRIRVASTAGPPPYVIQVCALVIVGAVPVYRAPEWADIGIMYQRTCNAGFHPHVNHRLVSFGFREPVHCTAVLIAPPFNG